MPRWLGRVLARVRKLALDGGLRLTQKAQREAVTAGLSPDDVRDVIASLQAEDWAARLVSEGTGEWMYVFTPRIGGERMYLKLVLRVECIVVSFHDDEGSRDEEE